MLVNNKWSLNIILTAGLIIAVTHATESPRLQQLPTTIGTSSLSTLSANYQQPPWLAPVTAIPTQYSRQHQQQQQRTARNLYAPYQAFSKVDDISYKDVRQRSDGTVFQTFGSYRTARNQRDQIGPFIHTTVATMDNGSAQRRSDAASSVVEIVPAPSVELPPNELITIPKQLVPTIRENVTRTGRKRNYVYIPLQQNTEAGSLLQLRPNRNLSLAQLGPPEDAVAAVAQDFNDQLVPERTDRSDVLPATATSSSSTSTTDKFDHDEESSSRRVGFQFPSYNLKPASPFHPQSYREDNPIFTETSGYEQPYSEDVTPTQYEQDTRHTRQLVFEPEVTHVSHGFDFPGLSANSKPHTLNSAVAAGKLYRDEVTKFGDINGPITAIPQRPPRGIYFGDTEFRTGPPAPVRQYGPQKNFQEYVAPVDYQGSRQSRYVPFKSSRSPRVVFPANDNIGTTGPSGSGPSGTGVYFSDNLAFRDQNFGLNELAAVQDVRNDFSLQDLDSVSEATGGPQSASTFKEKGKLSIKAMPNKLVIAANG